MSSQDRDAARPKGTRGAIWQATALNTLKKLQSGNRIIRLIYFGSLIRTMEFF